jgi:hypothetical protein
LLIIASDSALLNHAVARAAAFAPMVEKLAKDVGISPSLLAAALHNPHQFLSPVDDPPLPSPHTEQVRQAVGQAIELYFHHRQNTTKPHESIAEALQAIRHRVAQAENREPEIVAVSSLPPIALAPYLAPLRQVLDGIYSVHPPELAGKPEYLSSPPDNWARSISSREIWPHPDILRGLCERHGQTPDRTVFLSGLMAGEIAAAQQTGMRTVYLRLGAGREGLPPQPPGANAMPLAPPDALVVRIEDLAKLPLFSTRSAAAERPSSTRPRRQDER